VATTLGTIPLIVFFKRVLVGNKLLEWHHLLARLENIDLHVGRETFFYLLKNNDSFTVDSMYRYLLTTE